ncbi:peptide chain release factor N(5)-glutamine methyltransferase [Draconibacterium sp.]|nr:peptide chain release factor N(5)-glutamine methyltransferase [Draconibacterium sp.]
MTSDSLYNDVFQDISQNFIALPDKPEETPESTLKALWMTAAGQPVSAVQAMTSTLPTLNEDTEKELRRLIALFQQGTPLAHISERQNFCGLELLVTPEALIPRKETEILAKATLQVLSEHNTQAPLIVDVCTGCGNLALLYAKHFPEARVFGADLSASAIQLAKRNHTFTEVKSSVEFFQGDLLEPFLNSDFEGKVDILSCNPPYISSKKVPAMAEEISNHEPAMAFDGGVFGISILQKLIKQAPQLVKSGGHVIFELGLGQGPAMLKKIERDPNYSRVEGRTDEQGNIRAIIATRARTGAN